MAQLPPASPYAGAGAASPLTPGSAGKRRGAAQLHKTGYSYEGLDGADWLEGEWQKPSLDKAMDLYLDHLFQNGEASVWGTTIDDLEQLGPGVALYFTLLRVWYCCVCYSLSCVLTTDFSLQHLACFFILATVMTAPIIMFSYSGGSLATLANAAELDALHASLLSIANVGLPPDSSDPAVLLPLGKYSSYAFSRRGASVAIASVDFAMVFAFLVFSGVLRWSMAVASRNVRKHVTKASDYAVYVTGLPRDATEEEVCFATPYKHAHPRSTHGNLRFTAWRRFESTSRTSIISVNRTGPLRRAAADALESCARRLKPSWPAYRAACRV